MKDPGKICIQEWKMKDKGWKILLGLAGIFSLLMTFLAIYGDQGWQGIKRFQQEIDKLQNRIELLQQENQSLAGEVQKLKDEPYYLEKIAREELGMVRSGEKVFIITKKKDWGRSPIARPDATI